MMSGNRKPIALVLAVILTIILLILASILFALKTLVVPGLIPFLSMTLTVLLYFYYRKQQDLYKWVPYIFLVAALINLAACIVQILASFQ